VFAELAGLFALWEAACCGLVGVCEPLQNI
jgi:hypothetical protein